MPSVKQQVISIIRGLPDSVTVDQIMEKLYFKLKVEAGLRELDEGKGLNHDEVAKRLEKWTKN
ncbi:MAG: hypothetical protein PHW04_08460 [Candidatus Wallbacteria bacterium]|nr:hypothetical protein [Candidatus Wallbacteria bacterium]